MFKGSRKSAKNGGGICPFMFQDPTNTRTFRSGKYFSSSSAPNIDVGPTLPQRYERVLAWLTSTGCPAISAAEAAAANKHVIDLDFPWFILNESLRIAKVAREGGGVLLKFSWLFESDFWSLAPTAMPEPSNLLSFVPEADLRMAVERRSLFRLGDFIDWHLVKLELIGGKFPTMAAAGGDGLWDVSYWSSSVDTRTMGGKLLWLKLLSYIKNFS